MFHVPVIIDGQNNITSGLPIRKQENKQNFECLAENSIQSFVDKTHTCTELQLRILKVAIHSFQVPMPNIQLFLNYSCFAALSLI